MAYIISAADSNNVINYLSKISAEKDSNIFCFKWNNSVLIKNYNDDGTLVDISKTSSYIEPWIQLSLKPFKNNGLLFPLFSCMSCSHQILNLYLEQDPKAVHKHLCGHGKVASTLLPD